MAFLFLLHVLWFIAPSYTANGSPPVIRGRIPLDGGKKIGGKRIFGDGKTIEGTIGGILFGTCIGLLQSYAQPYMPQSLGLPVMTVQLAVLLSIGAFCGDLIGSFIKRRIGIRSGEPALFLDQEGFLITSLLLAAAAYSISIEMAVILLIITPPIHWITNVIGYIMRFKKHPW